MTVSTWIVTNTEDPDNPLPVPLAGSVGASAASSGAIQTLGTADLSGSASASTATAASIGLISSLSGVSAAAASSSMVIVCGVALRADIIVVPAAFADLGMSVGLSAGVAATSSSRADVSTQVPSAMFAFFM